MYERLCGTNTKQRTGHWTAKKKKEYQECVRVCNVVVGINSSSRLKGSMELRSLVMGLEELRRKIGDAVLHTLVFFSLLFRLAILISFT